jgi:DNA uptake protein ComE-like DNA-binding protein
MSTIGGLLIFVVVIAGCIQLRSLRREVYDTSEAVLAERDPAVARALAARAKREEARRILAKDPSLARDLGIGRPDLGKGFDDGGLVDLNSADAATIARVCEIPQKYAETIVAARGTRGGAYFNVGEALVDVDLPPDVQERLQDRCIVYESQF